MEFEIGEFVWSTKANEIVKVVEKKEDWDEDFYGKRWKWQWLVKVLFSSAEKSIILFRKRSDV